MQIHQLCPLAVLAELGRVAELLKLTIRHHLHSKGASPVSFLPLGPLQIILIQRNPEIVKVLIKLHEAVSNLIVGRVAAETLEQGIGNEVVDSSEDCHDAEGPDGTHPATF